jgi:acyl transferase domain-containing protein
VPALAGAMGAHAGLMAGLGHATATTWCAHAALARVYAHQASAWVEAQVNEPNVVVAAVAASATVVIVRRLAGVAALAERARAVGRFVASLLTLVI